MAEFSGQMCACRDKACAEAVQEALTKWSTDMAAKAADHKDHTVDEPTMRRMTELGTAYGECMTRAMKPPEPAPMPKATEPPEVPRTPPQVAAPFQVDKMLIDARSWARSRRKEHVIRHVRFSFVDADGVFDSIDGQMEIEFGRTDDSEAKRRIGAPIRPRVLHDDCFSLRNGDGPWISTRIPCVDAPSYVARCTVRDIWKRAIKGSAPAEAVAVISFDATARSWELGIDDEPRNVHVHMTFADDCPLTVEK